MTLIDLSSYSVLLVDDVSFSRQMVTKLLKGLGLQEIHQAKDGNVALDVLQENPGVDLVVCDFKMPNFNGLQLLKAIRTGKTNIKRETPFAMLTGYSDCHLVDMALALDINAFLTKPVSQKTLSDRLGKMLAPDDRKKGIKPADAYEEVVVEEAEEEEEKEKEKAPATQEAGDDNLPPRPGPVLRNSEETTKVLKNMSSLSGKLKECDLARNITKGVDKLVTDTSPSIATRIVSFIDNLVKRKILGIEDVPDVLDLRNADQDKSDDAMLDRKTKAIAKTRTKAIAETKTKANAETKGGKAEEFYYKLPEIPLGAILSQDIFAQDGSLFIKKGTPLTQQVVSILARLGRSGVLEMPPGGEIAVTHSESGPNGVYANFSPVPGETDPVAAYESENPPSEGFTHAVRGDYAWERQVPVHEIPEGATLARDIYTVDGRLYMHAGNKLTVIMVALLKDLQELGHLPTETWITK